MPRKALFIKHRNVKATLSMELYSVVPYFHRYTALLKRPLAQIKDRHDRILHRLLLDPHYLISSLLKHAYEFKLLQGGSKQQIHIADVERRGDEYLVTAKIDGKVIRVFSLPFSALKTLSLGDKRVTYEAVAAFLQRDVSTVEKQAHADYAALDAVLEPQKKVPLFRMKFAVLAGPLVTLYRLQELIAKNTLPGMVEDCKRRLKEDKTFSISRYFRDTKAAVAGQLVVLLDALDKHRSDFQSLGIDLDGGDYTHYFPGRGTNEQKAQAFLQRIDLHSIDVVKKVVHVAKIYEEKSAVQHIVMLRRQIEHSVESIQTESAQLKQAYAAQRNLVTALQGLGHETNDDVRLNLCQTAWSLLDAKSADLLNSIPLLSDKIGALLKGVSYSSEIPVSSHSDLVHIMDQVEGAVKAIRDVLANTMSEKQLRAILSAELGVVVKKSQALASLAQVFPEDDALRAFMQKHPLMLLTKEEVQQRVTTVIEKAGAGDVSEIDDIAAQARVFHRIDTPILKERMMLRASLHDVRQNYQERLDVLKQQSQREKHVAVALHALGCDEQGVFDAVVQSQEAIATKLKEIEQSETCLSAHIEAMLDQTTPPTTIPMINNQKALASHKNVIELKFDSASAALAIVSGRAELLRDEIMAALIAAAKKSQAIHKFKEAFSDNKALQSFIKRHLLPLPTGQEVREKANTVLDAIREGKSIRFAMPTEYRYQHIHVGQLKHQLLFQKQLNAIIQVFQERLDNLMKRFKMYEGHLKTCENLKISIEDVRRVFPNEEKELAALSARLRAFQQWKSLVDSQIEAMLQGQFVEKLTAIEKQKRKMKLAKQRSAFNADLMSRENSFHMFDTPVRDAIRHFVQEQLSQGKQHPYESGDLIRDLLGEVDVYIKSLASEKVEFSRPLVFSAIDLQLPALQEKVLRYLDDIFQHGSRDVSTIQRFEWAAALVTNLKCMVKTAELSNSTVKFIDTHTYKALCTISESLVTKLEYIYDASQGAIRQLAGDCIIRYYFSGIFNFDSAIRTNKATLQEKRDAYWVINKLFFNAAHATADKLLRPMTDILKYDLEPAVFEDKLTADKWLRFLFRWDSFKRILAVPLARKKIRLAYIIASRQLETIKKRFEAIDKHDPNNREKMAALYDELQHLDEQTKEVYRSCVNDGQEDHAYQEYLARLESNFHQMKRHLDKAMQRFLDYDAAVIADNKFKDVPATASVERLVGTFGTQQLLGSDLAHPETLSVDTRNALNAFDREVALAAQRASYARQVSAAVKTGAPKAYKVRKVVKAPQASDLGRSMQAGTRDAAAVPASHVATVPAASAAASEEPQPALA